MPMDERLAERIRTFFALPADVTERRMFGGVGWMVDADAVREDAALGRWLERASAFAASLPPK